MLRMFAMECVVFRSYIRQLMLTGVLVSLFMCIGMKSIVAIPGMVSVMVFMMLTMSAAAYDEQNGWELYRLSMPLSRRDVVRGRYLVIASLGCMGMLVALALVLLVGLVCQTLPIPADVAKIFSLAPDNVAAVLFAMAICVLFNATVVGVVTPVYLRFGQIKAARVIPLLAVLAYTGVFALLAAGVGGQGALAFIGGLIEGMAASPAMMAAGIAGTILVALAVLALSMKVSCGLYERREL